MGDKMGVFWNVEASSANVFHNSKKLRLERMSEEGEPSSLA
jgi:hypothetical protein